MDTHIRHCIWELIVETGELVLASRLIERAGLGDTDIGTSQLKQKIADAELRGSSYVRCSECGCPLVFVAPNATEIEPHFRHQINRIHSVPNASEDKVKNCSFYTKNHSFFGSSSIYHGEGKWHFETKHWLASVLSDHPLVNSTTLRIEKYLFDKSEDVNERRRPDIYFETLSGDKFAFELTRWWMDPRVVQKRADFFKRKGVYVIWLFSPKCPEHSATTYNLILFSNNAPNKGVDLAFDKDSNVFVLSDAMKTLTELSGQLHLLVNYPSFSVNPMLGQLRTDIQSRVCKFSDLKLPPDFSTPVGVPTLQNYFDAQGALRAHLQNELSELRLGQSRVIRLARKAIKTQDYYALRDTLKQVYKLPHSVKCRKVLASRIESILSILKPHSQQSAVAHTHLVNDSSKKPTTGDNAQILEALAFIKELHTKGVSELPDSCSRDRIKFNRIVLQCKRQNRFDLVRTIESSLIDAENNFEKNFAAEFFPNILKKIETGHADLVSCLRELETIEAELKVTYRKGHRMYEKTRVKHKHLIKLKERYFGNYDEE
ncbi:DUF6035 family protein [Vibrio cholerae]|uniref:DUF6035 family protein n=1 Tax=Vibrio cholerae TaxID=666 RepID=UPI00301811E2